MEDRSLHRLWVRLLPLQLILIMGAIGLVAGVSGSMVIILLRGSYQGPKAVPPAATALPPSVGVVFTPEVQHWAPEILKWSQEYDIDANLLATVMQIESCGDPLAGSGVGAQGLFQLMPDHFKAGEDPHDPDTNALRGVEYLKMGLDAADGHIGLTLAGYNGGVGVIPLGWGAWYQETKLYYVWGTQIYLDAINGKTTAQSAALQDWLNAGGVNLCRQAAARLATPTPSPTGQAPVTSDQGTPIAVPTIAILPAQ